MLSMIRSIPVRLGLGLVLPLMPLAIAVEPPALAAPSQPAASQPPAAQAMQLRANITEANAKTGVVVARGNVQIDYPARHIQATAAQAVYFSKEGRIVLSGNVYILQDGNSLRGETVTYLVNEGRFVALPEQNRQVEAIYLVQDTPETAPAPTPVPDNPTPVKPAKLPFPVAPQTLPPSGSGTTQSAPQ